MKRRRAFGVLFGGLMIASTVTAPQAVADPCRWIAHDLPLPGGAVDARTNSSSESNRFIVGQTRIAAPGYADLGLIWDHGALSLMPSPGSMIGVHPRDVNDSGVVVGRQYFPSQERNAAFRYRNGAYEMLDTPADHGSQAIAVNNHGDIVGEWWSNAQPSNRQVVVWHIGGPVQPLQYGQAIGITDDRKVVQTTQWDPTTYVIDAETGYQTELRGGQTPMVLDNDRVLHYTSAGLKEWTTTGDHVATWEGGVWPYGKTSSGTVFGADGGGTATLWQWGIRYAVDSEKQPKSVYYGDVTDGGALIGTYEDAQQASHPARWFWCA
jgi:hypothetical protein